MIGARGLVLLAGLSPWIAACRETPRAKAAEVQAVEATRKQELARRLALADANPAKSLPVAKWIMPPELREISGLTLTSRGTVLTHDDNIGRVYEVDPKTGILLKGFSLEGGVRGDFEAITIAGSDIYLLESKGKIFKFKEGADASEVPYSVFDTRLGRECEFEGLAYEADSTRCWNRIWRSIPNSWAVSRRYFRMEGPSAMALASFQGRKEYPSVNISESERIPG